MEEKQLKLNQPLLSLRRGSGSSTTSPEVNKSSHHLPPLPYYRAELKSGPVSNPGAVPFQWEHTPGKPKNGSQEPGHTLISPLPLAPKLPPGRVANQKHKSIDETPTTSPGSSSWSQTQNKASPDENETEKEDNGAISSSEEDNTSVTYLDARDTLSQTGLSLNCSFSGVSGLDADASNKTLSDPQMQHLMMARFLPAAKAVASEAPQYASKKQPVGTVAKKEQPKPMKKVVNDKRSPIYYDAHIVSLQGNDKDEDEEEEDGVGKYQGHEDLSAKLCGLLPRFCLLNPIPGIRDHAQIVPQVPSLRTKSVHSVPSIKVKNKQRLMNLGGETKRINWQNVQTNRLSSNGHFGQKTIASLGLPGDFRVKVDVNPEKRFTILKEFLEDDRLEEEITGAAINPIKERTLYIDSGEIVDPRNSNSSSSESTKGRAGRTPSVDYALQDFLLLHCEENEEPKDSRRDDTGLLLAATTSQKIKQHNQDLSLVVHVQQKHVKETTTQEKSKSSPPTQLVLSTLLPKSPSESWLSRTLPSMPSKNPNSKTYLRGSTWDPNRGRVLTSSNAELAPIMEN